MAEVEAAGDLITGGLVAGAIERESRTRALGEEHHALCLNCGTGLLGAHCHRCGQPEHVHRSLSAIWHDIAHGVLHFEGKIWNTLPLLAWRPGDLTRRYVAGERARFVSPMALFLFSVFLMFAVLSALGAKLGVEAFTGERAPEARADLQRELGKLDAAIAEARARGAPTAVLERQRAAVAAVGAAATGEPDGARLVASIETGIPSIDKALAKAEANPNLLLYKIQANAYKFSWALIPISTPFLWLMFAWRRQYRVYDHAVFVTYSLSFMTLLIVLVTIANQVSWLADLGMLALFVVPPVHMYRQMRGAYRLRRRSAALRTAALLFCAQVSLITFGLLLVAMGAFG